MSSTTINIGKGLECVLSNCDRTSFEIWTVPLGVDGDVDGGAVPAHISKRLLTRFLDLARSLDDGLHELRVAAAQMSLGGHQAGQQLAVLGLVDV